MASQLQCVTVGKARYVAMRPKAAVEVVRGGNSGFACASLSAHALRRRPRRAQRPAQRVAYRPPGAVNVRIAAYAARDGARCRRSFSFACARLAQRLGVAVGNNTRNMFDKWISELLQSVLRWFVDVEWERLSLTWWSGAHFSPRPLRVLVRMLGISYGTVV